MGSRIRFYLTFYTDVFYATRFPLCDRRVLLFAKFEALLAECDIVADNSAYGKTLNDMEEFFLMESHL